MTDDIPDDVVERALAVYWQRPMDNEHLRRMRAALRVAVEWERERCARFEQNRDWVNGSLYDTLRRAVAAANRARGEG